MSEQTSTPISSQPCQAFSRAVYVYRVLYWQHKDFTMLVRFWSQKEELKWYLMVVIMLWEWGSAFACKAKVEWICKMPIRVHVSCICSSSPPGPVYVYFEAVNLGFFFDIMDKLWGKDG